MTRIQEILEKFDYIAHHPKESMEDFKKKSGKGAIGVLPVYSPEEIIYAAGYLPIGLWGGQKNIRKASAHLPAFGCSIMQSVKELELEGAYDDLEAVIFSSPCDTLKCMGQMWKGNCPSIQFAHPQNRNLESANIFLKEEYKEIQRKLEEIIGAEIPEESLNEAIDIYNQNRRIMRDFTKIAGNYSQTIDPVVRHNIMKSRFFMDKKEHTALMKELLKELQDMKEENASGPKVILTGILAEPDGFLELFKEMEITVVADDLAQESRQFRVDVPDGEDPLYRLAKGWQDMYGCSLATDRKKGRVEMLADMVQEYNADAVIVCMMKFCDPEEFDFPIMYKKFEEEKIKNLLLEVDQQAGSFEQTRTRIQSFVEML